MLERLKCLGRGSIISSTLMKCLVRSTQMSSIQIHNNDISCYIYSHTVVKSRQKKKCCATPVHFLQKISQHKQRSQPPISYAVPIHVGYWSMLLLHFTHQASGISHNVCIPTQSPVASGISHNVSIPTHTVTSGLVLHK